MFEKEVTGYITFTGVPEGTKMIGEWSRLDGSDGYMLYEQDKLDYSWTMMWNHLLDIKIVPVLDAVIAGKT